MAISLMNYLTNFYNKQGDALISREALTNLANFTLGASAPITALAGGAQAASPTLVYGVNEITTVATTNDSVQLPSAIQGAQLVVNNNSANTAKIYANASPNLANASALDQIVANATVTKTANATAITLASGYALIFVCTTSGVWKQTGVAS
jgi:hypothetical protein